MADSIENLIINMISQNSQGDSAADDSKIEDSRSKKALKARKKELEELGKTEEQIRIQLEEDLAEIRAHEEESTLKKKFEKEKSDLEEIIKHGATLQERLQAERQLKEKQFQENLASITSEAIKNVLNGVNETFYAIKNSGKDYAEYVERIEVGLLGVDKGYDSVTSKLDKVFSMNVFFSMEDALNRTTEMIENGIAYNVELRAGLDVMSDKIVKSFDSLDATLTRLVKIQQADSTQARLGMESLLLNYLNSSFQNSEYLHGVSDQVSALLLETSSRLDKDEAVELEYAVQKWLGSMSSVGVSDDTVLALARGLGYLGSGNVSALTGDNALQQLMAISATRGGGRSYGEILTSGINVQDVSNILTGFYSLVSEIKNSGNLVALSQYASLFNLTISDIESVLNLTAEDISKISKDMVTYEQTIKQVEDELSTSKLYKRSAVSELITNLQKNFMTGIGLDMADSLSYNLSYMVADLAASMMDQLDLGTEIHPWGIGASVDLDVGTMIRGGMVTGSYLAQLIQGASSLFKSTATNLSTLGGEENVTVQLIGGDGPNLNTGGITTNQAAYAGRTDNSAIYQMVNQQSKEQTSEVMSKDVDEEAKKMEKLSEAMLEISDNVEFIVQLLDINGIKVRWYPGISGGSTPTIGGIASDSAGQNKDFYMSGGY